MGKTSRRLTGVTVLLALLSSCSSSPSEDAEAQMMIQQRGGEQRIFIDHHKLDCQGEVYRTCLRTRGSEQDPWTYFYDAIEGFEFEWGYQYELRVRVTEVADPPGDGSSIDYSLVELVQKVKVDEDSSFEFSLMPVEGFTERLSANEFQLGREVNFRCDVSTCDSVASLLTQEMAMVLNFQHANDSTGRLRLQKVLCSDTPPQFYESCLGQQ